MAEKLVVEDIGMEIGPVPVAKQSPRWRDGVDDRHPRGGGGAVAGRVDAL